MKRVMVVVALALGALAGCFPPEGGGLGSVFDIVVRNQTGSPAEATCAARGAAAGSPDYQDCVEALRRGKIYVGPDAHRDTLNGLYYQACVAANHPSIGCSCLVNQLGAYGLTDRGMRSLLINAGIIWQPPVSQFYDVTPINLTTQKCHLRYP
jgi:hypothetical protein